MSGFQSPNYTQTPNELFDVLLPEMGKAELKVVLAIIRRTFGYHREEVKISIRDLARATGLRSNSVMVGAKLAEDHGLIERYQDGNTTTLWRSRVSVSETPRLSNRDASVSGTETLSGVKERKKESKEIAATRRKPDLIDGMLEYQKPTMTLIQAVDKFMPFNTNWETKTARQWLEWAHNDNVTPEQIEKAADVWRREKKFNWRNPNLKLLFENWPALKEYMQPKLQPETEEYPTL